MISLLLWAESFGRHAVPFALNFVWQSTLVVAVAAGTAYLLRRQRVADRRAVWQTALFVCLLLPIVSPLFHGLGVDQPLLPGVRLDDVTGRWADFRMLRISTVPRGMERVERPAAGSAPVFEPPVETRGWLALGNVLHRLRPAADADAQRAAVVIDMLYVITGGLYALAIVLFALRFMAGIAWLGWVRVCSKPLLRPDLQPILADVCGYLDLSRVPQVRISRYINSPSVFGLHNPTVIVPALLGSWLTGLQLRQVLAHELAHVRSRDYVYGMMFRTLQVGLFCQPLLSVVINKLREEAELLADNVAVSLSRRRGQDPLSYAELLVYLAELSHPSFAEKFAATAIISAPSQLSRRVDAILARDARPTAVLTPRRKSYYQLGGLALLGVMSTTSIVAPPNPADFVQPVPPRTSEADVLPPLLGREPFSFEVERIFSLPAELEGRSPRGVVFDQELERFTFVGERWIAQCIPAATADRLLCVVPPRDLPRVAEAVTLAEPALVVRARIDAPWAAGGALALCPIDGGEIWFAARELSGSDALRLHPVPAPAPEPGGRVVGLASTVDTRLPGELVRVMGANRPGQIDFLHLRSEGGAIPPRFERRVSSYGWDLRERERNAGILAPLRGVAVDPFEEMLYVVDAGNPEPDTPPGGRVQAFSYAPDFSRDAITGPLHRRYWSALLDYQIALAGEHWPVDGAMQGFEDVCFSRTGERVYVLYRAAQGPYGSDIPAGVAVLRRPHVSLRLAQRTVHVGDFVPVALLATVPLPPDARLALVSSDPEVAEVSLDLERTEQGGMLRGGVVRAVGTGSAVVAVFCADLPGESQRISVLPRDR